MSREGWDKAEGYAELELYSFFIDGLFMYEAHYAGLRETVLPQRVSTTWSTAAAGSPTTRTWTISLLASRTARNPRSLLQRAVSRLGDPDVQGQATGHSEVRELGYSDEPLQEQWVIRCRTDSNLTSAAS